jgi:hypothetical protein
MDSQTLAAGALAFATGSDGQACLRRAFLGGGLVGSESGREEALFRQVRVSPLHLRVPGVPVLWMRAMRATATVAALMSDTPGREPYYEDLAGFALGPSVIFLKVTSSPRDPTALERRLLPLLYDRAEQAAPALPAKRVLIIK